MIKRILFYVTSMLYLFVSTFLLPEWFIWAFNYSKGIANNQDGIIFIPFGFVMIVLTVLIDVLIVKKAIKINRENIFKITLVLVGLIVIIAISTIMNMTLWQNFFECLAYFKTLNLERQI